MNTSLIKKERTNENIQTVVKINRGLLTNTAHRKNDLLTMLREENAALYGEYLEVIKRNTELRAIVEKQQKLINAIYNAELKLLLPVEEEPITSVIKNEPLHEEIKAEDPVNIIPVIEPLAVEIEKPEIKTPQPLEFDKLKSRIRSLRRKKIQLQSSLDEKTKFLLYLYHHRGVRPDDLFTALGLTHPTGFRYVGFFRKFKFVGFSGNNRTGLYFLRTEGTKFVEGEEMPELKLK